MTVRAPSSSRKLEPRPGYLRVGVSGTNPVGIVPIMFALVPSAVRRAPVAWTMRSV